MLLITKIFHFEAAHFLPGDIYGRCKNLHGHSYELRVSVSNKDGLTDGMVFNFSNLSRIVKENIIEKFDHTVLNESMGLAVPTAENVLSRFYEILKERLPYDIQVEKLILWETNSSFATWKK